MKDLTIYILTHNRGELLLETIDSVLSQNCNDFRFVVSDNSSNNETYDLLKKKGYLDKFEYIKRDKEYPSFDHFNLCLSEVKTKYFMLFHDDDVMMPEMVETLYEKINQSDYIAVGCNAYKMNDNIKTNGSFLKKNTNILINSEEQLIQQYLSDEIVPFPAYIYNYQKISNYKYQFDESVGKYSDVAWLVKLCKYNKLFWVKDKLMYYRIHKNQDSKTIDFFNQLLLINLFNKYSKDIKSKKKLSKIRITFLYGYESQKKKKYRNWKIYFKYSFFYFFPRVFIKNLVQSLFCVRLE